MLNKSASTHMLSPGAPPGSVPVADEPAETGTGPPGGQDNALLFPRALVLDKHSLVPVIRTQAYNMTRVFVAV